NNNNNNNNNDNHKGLKLNGTNTRRNDDENNNIRINNHYVHNNNPNNINVLVSTYHQNSIKFEPLTSPLIECIVLGAFNIPKPLKITFLETHYRILLHRASELLLYIENQQKALLQFYDSTSHIRNSADFTKEIPPAALHVDIMKKFEQQLVKELEISSAEDLLVFLSIAETFRPNLFFLLYLNPVFEQEFEDILKYFLF
ncbi:protein tyrosine phosphatase, partial [Reticulomyxa filosa]